MLACMYVLAHAMRCFHMHDHHLRILIHQTHARERGGGVCMTKPSRAGCIVKPPQKHLCFVVDRTVAPSILLAILFSPSPGTPTLPHYT